MGPDFTNAKLANFDLSREHKQKSSNEIEFVGEILPWLAPEKLRDYDDCRNVRYTHKCEVYRYSSPTTYFRKYMLIINLIYF
jgi:hypothetical protein